MNIPFDECTQLKHNKLNCNSFNGITIKERMYLSYKTRYNPSSIVISLDEYFIWWMYSIKTQRKQIEYSFNGITIDE